MTAERDTERSHDPASIHQRRRLPPEEQSVLEGTLMSDQAKTTSMPAADDPLEPASLWVAFAPPLRAFLARRVPPGVEADDLVQDVFLRRDSARGEPSKCGTS
jgi:hypothetical protein